MAQYNIKNERIKKQYEQYLAMDERLSGQTIYGKIKDIRKYEEFTGFKCFTTFNKDQAVGFKNHYRKSGGGMSYATVWRTLKNLKAFFTWLSQQSGYRSKVRVDYVRAFNLSMKEENIARHKAFKDAPTVEQVRAVINQMPTDTEQQKRDRAIVALTLVTGIRVTALTSLKVKHVDEYKRLVKQNPNEVKTKFSKAILTQFFPVGENVHQVVLDWVRYLKEEKLMGQDTPLFPAILSQYDADTGGFKKGGLSDRHITSTSTVREVFKAAFEGAGMQYYHPHLFRTTLTQLGQTLCKSPEAFKAWSQNLGHSSPLTTFTSYGEVYATRQCEIIRDITGS